MAQDTLDRNDFPPIGENGKVSEAGATVKDQIIESGVAKFGRRFAVQWNGLTAGGKLSPAVLRAGRLGAVIGWQTNQFQGPDGSACNDVRSPQPTACTEDAYRAILQRGIDEGARYIEIWPPDAVEFPEAVLEAEAELSGQ